MDGRSVSRGYGKREGGEVDYVTKEEKKKGGRMKKRIKGGWREKGWNRDREREGEWKRQEKREVEMVGRRPKGQKKRRTDE